MYKFLTFALSVAVISPTLARAEGPACSSSSADAGINLETVVTPTFDAIKGRILPELGTKLKIASDIPLPEKIPYSTATWANCDASERENTFVDGKSIHYAFPYQNDVENRKGICSVSAVVLENPDCKNDSRFTIPLPKIVAGDALLGKSYLDCRYERWAKAGTDLGDFVAENILVCTTTFQLESSERLSREGQPKIVCTRHDGVIDFNEALRMLGGQIAIVK